MTVLVFETSPACRANT